MSLLERLDALNRQWGQLVGHSPRIHLFLSAIFVLLFGLHMKEMCLERDIRRSFSSSSSRAAYENRVYKEFFNLTVSPQRSFVLFSSRDGGSVLRRPQLSDIRAMDRRITGFLSEVDPETGMPGCSPLCNLNKPFHLILDHLLSNNSKDMLLDFPISHFHGVPLFIGMNAIGAEVSEKVFESNNSKIISVRTIILWYFFRADSPTAKNRLRDFSLELFALSQSRQTGPHIHFEIFGDEIANSEMVRGAIEATVLMSIGFGLLVVFVSATVLQKMRRINCAAVPVIVLAVVVCPFMGCVVAFGLCTWMGFPTYTIMCVCPFLVQGVGVDDAFIMLQSWAQHSHIRQPIDRLSQVFIHIGPSVTITSLTNTIAFGIGFFTPTPQMSLFCLCTSLALFADYILTFTFLAPIIFLSTPVDPLDSTDPKQIALLESSTDSETDENPLKKVPKQILCYAKFVCSNGGRLTMILGLLIMHSFAAFGVMKMKASFEPSKAFPSDSPLAKSMDSVRTVFNEFFPVNIIVNRPPQISDRSNRERFYEMVAELESLPEAYGSERTLLWLRAYERMDRQAAEVFSLIGFNSTAYEPSYDNLEFFLDQLGRPPTIRTKEENGTLVPSAFQFSVITRGMAEWSNRAVTENRFRQILLRFPEFNATIYDGDSAVLDLLLTLKLDLIGSMAVTIVCMLIVCSVFIHNKIGIFLVGLSIASVCFALVGFLALMGSDLDMILLIDCLLATGLTVDYLHIAHRFCAHQYYNREGVTQFVRLALSLNEMCGPMLQAGISTVLCMLPLIFVPTYAIMAFAKTVYFVVIVGLFHGLFILPVWFCWLPDRYGSPRDLPKEISST